MSWCDAQNWVQRYNIKNPNVQKKLNFICVNKKIFVILHRFFCKTVLVKAWGNPIIFLATEVAVK